MIGITLLLLLAAAGYAASLRLRLPVVPFLLAAGFAAALAGVAPEQATVAGMAEFGLAFLVFAAGIELSPRRFTHQTRPVLWVAGGQFIVVGLVGFAVVVGLGYDHLPALYIGFAISASSTVVVIRHLRAQRQMFQPFGRLVTGVLLYQDVALIILLAILAAAPGGWKAVGLSFAGIAILSAAALLFHRWAIPAVAKYFEQDEETLLLVGLAVLFGFLGAAFFLGLPLIAGAFVAGFTLSCFPVNGLLRGLLGSMTDFFHAIFFVALGVLIQVPTLALVSQALLLTVFVFLVTPPLVAALAEWQGQSSRSGIESGLLLAQTSELGIVLALSGLYLGHVGEDVFTLIALVAAFTMAATPFIATDRMAWKLTHLKPGARIPYQGSGQKDHILILGFGGAGMWVVKPLMEAGHDVLVVDDDPVIVTQLSKSKIPCFRGDGSDERVLEAAGADRAKLIIASLPRVADLVKVIRYAGRDRVVARVFEHADAEIIERAGGIPVLNSEAAAVQFLEWFDSQGKTLSGSSSGKREART